MSIRRAPAADLTATMDAVLAVARSQGLDQKRLAQLAGVRAETITRAKNRRTVDWNTLRALANAAGLDLRVVALKRPTGDGLGGLADPALKLAWSNPAAPQTALVAKAIESRSFDLLLRAVQEHGIESVASVAQRLRDEQAVPVQTLDYADRALRNIALGFSRALATRH